jgi:hypothetical protein
VRCTRLASRLLGVPVALVSLVDDERQHFPGMTGLDGWAAAARGLASPSGGDELAVGFRVVRGDGAKLLAWCRRALH